MWKRIARAYSRYVLLISPQGPAPVATAVLFFAVVNYVKLLPYAWLGQLAGGNLMTSLALSPLAPIGVMIGVYLHKRVSDRVFFVFVYLLLFLVGLRLIYDGLFA